MPEKDININVKANAQQAKAELDSFAKSTQQAGEKVENSGQKADKASGMMNALGGAVNSLKGWLIGLVSISGLISFFERWIEKLKETKKAQDELVESTKGLEAAVKALAAQEGLLGSQKGQDISRAQILDIQRMGNLSSWELASAVGVSAHSAMGTVGQPLSQEQMAIAGVVGGFAQRYNVSEGGVNQLFKVLAQMGVKTEAEAARRVQQLLTVQGQSRAKTFEEFITGGIKALIPSMAAGASPEMAMALFAKSMDTEASADLAAQRTKDASTLLLDPDIIKALGGESFRGLPYDERIRRLADWFNATPQKALTDRFKVSSTTIGNLGPYFTDPKRREQLYGYATGATAEKFFETAAGFQQTALGQVEASQADILRLEGAANLDETVGKAAMDWAAAKFKLALARGESVTLPFAGREREIQVYAMKLLQKEVEAAKRKAAEQGIGEGVFEGLEEEMLRATQIDIGAPSNAPGGLDVTPGEMGGLLKGFQTVIHNHNIHYSSDMKIQYPLRFTNGGREAGVDGGHGH